MLTSFTKSLRAVVAVLGAVVMTMLFVAVPTAQADHGEGTFKSGNQSCAELGDWNNSFKVEPVTSGVYEDDDGPLEVEITVRETDDGPVLDWTELSDVGVEAAFVKGGPNGMLYEYDDASSDTGLHAPVNDENDKYYGLSHVSFCYDVDVGLTVEKTNDANDDGAFNDEETAPVEGADVEFQVVITNPSDSEAAVDLSSATDEFGDTTVNLFDECDNLSDDTVIAAGDSVTCTFTLEGYAPAAGESLENVVTVEGHEDGDTENATEPAEDNSFVEVDEQQDDDAVVSLTVEKSNDANDDGEFNETETAPVEGAEVAFLVEITNTSDSAAVELSSATDAFGDTTVDLFDECSNLSDDTVIAAGDSVTCTFTLEGYAPAAGESLENVVTVEGHEDGDSENATEPAEDNSFVEVDEQQDDDAVVSLTVEKSNDANDDGEFNPSETAPVEDADVAFQVTITNTSDSAAVDLSSATDAFGDTTVDLFDECDNLSDDTVLAAGDSVTCTFTLEDYAPAAGESLENVVTVEGHEKGDTDNTTSDEDDSEVTTEEEDVAGETDERDEDQQPVTETAQPDIALDKEALVSPGASGRMTVTYVPGDGDEETVEYRYRITNTGDTTLEQLTLTDDVLGTIELDDTTLEPGESTTATATHVVTEEDADEGLIVNVATTTGTAPDGAQVDATDDALVLVSEVQPAVESADERVDRAPASDRLPRTGADPLGWSALAIGLMIFGGVALVATRQRATAA